MRQREVDKLDHAAANIEPTLLPHQVNSARLVILPLVR